MNKCKCGRDLPPYTGRGRPSKWCSENCRKRTWEREQDRAFCVRCGAEIGGHTIRRGGAHCAECFRADLIEAADIRRQRIVDLWNAGYTLHEIGDVLGMTKGTLGVQMVRMRKAGWDLPYAVSYPRQRVAA